MIDELASETGLCDIAVAGINVITEYLEKGLQFTWTTYRNGLSILVSEKEESYSHWAFMSSFSWELWLATILTAISVGLLVYLVEHWAGLSSAKRRGVRHGELGIDAGDMQRNVWQALGKPMQVGGMEGRSFASNLIILVFSFMVLILVTLYTAITAANITARQLQTTIEGLVDLPGKRVGTWSLYTNELHKLGVHALGLPWDTQEDWRAMVGALERGELQALVLDTSYLNYKEAAICNASTVGGQFHMFDQAVAFPAGFNNHELMSRYNSILVSIRESGEMEDLIRKYVDPPPSPCKHQLVNEDRNRVTFRHVAGLWILLGATVGIAVLLLVVQQLLHWRGYRVTSRGWYTRSRLRLARTGGARAFRGRTSPAPDGSPKQQAAAGGSAKSSCYGGVEVPTVMPFVMATAGTPDAADAVSPAGMSSGWLAVVMENTGQASSTRGCEKCGSAMCGDMSPAETPSAPDL